LDGLQVFRGVQAGCVDVMLFASGFGGRGRVWVAQRFSAAIYPSSDAALAAAVPA
jgi:hypothetical protein